MRSRRGTIALLVPVWNDWPSALRLQKEIERLSLECTYELFFVDDGSSDPAPEALQGATILELHGNFGHQRALACGLGYLASQGPGKFDGVLCMDGDGQDLPSGIPLLLKAARAHPGFVVTASRSSRSERALFRLGYRMFKLLFRLFTGKVLDFGNFLYLPWAAVQELSLQPSLAFHLPATVLRLERRWGREKILLPRGQRYEGRSGMGGLRLLEHGRQAFGVFRRQVQRRWLLAGGGLSLALLATGSFSAVVAVALCLGAGMAVLPRPGSGFWVPLVDGPRLIRKVRPRGEDRQALVLPLPLPPPSKRQQAEQTQG